MGWDASWVLTAWSAKTLSEFKPDATADSPSLVVPKFLEHQPDTSQHTTSSSTPPSPYSRSWRCYYFWPFEFNSIKFVYSVSLTQPQGLPQHHQCHAWKASSGAVKRAKCVGIQHPWARNRWQATKVRVSMSESSCVCKVRRGLFYGAIAIAFVESLVWRWGT